MRTVDLMDLGNRDTEMEDSRVEILLFRVDLLAQTIDCYYKACQ